MYVSALTWIGEVPVSKYVNQMPLRNRSPGTEPNGAPGTPLGITVRRRTAERSQEEDAGGDGRLYVMDGIYSE